MVGWLLCGVLGLMPFRYRPLRYGLFLYLPMSAICAYAIGVIAERRPKFCLQNKLMSLPFIFLVLWYIATQVRIYFSPFGEKFGSGVESLLITFLIASIAVGIIYFWLRNNRIAIPHKALTAIIVLISITFIVRQGIYFSSELIRPYKYLTNYSKELGSILKQDAVLAGPYGATLTVDNNMKNIIYMFGLSNVERNLFSNYPVSHVAADIGSWKLAVSDFPFLDSAVKIIQMPLQKIPIDIYRIPGANVAPTDFEKGSIFISQGRVDSAYIYFRRFSDQHQEHFFGKTHLAYSAFLKGSLDESLGIINSLLADRENDYVLHGFCKALFLQYYKATNNNKYFLLSKYHESREAELK